jgi:endogenous inhibitor of DNA gyrase (YacG/DUF329 family)
MIVRYHDPDETNDEDWGDSDDDDDATDPCPHCGEPVYDDAERCPYCGRYLSREDVRESKPWWVVLGVMMCLAMVTWWILHP